MHFSKEIEKSFPLPAATLFSLYSELKQKKRDQLTARINGFIE